MNKIIENNLNIDIFYKALFRLNEKILTKKILLKAKEANFWMIFYGVENGNQKMLKSMNKNIKLYEIVRGFQLTREAGITSYASFMIGNMGETESTVYDSINLMKVIKPDFGGFVIAAPFPGTKLYEEATQKNLIINHNFKDYNFGESILNTENLTINELESLVELASVEFSKWKTSNEYTELSKKFTFHKELFQYRLDREYLNVKIEVLEKLNYVSVSQTFYLNVKVTNLSNEQFKSSEPFPIRLAYHWFNIDKNEFEIFDGVRTPFDTPLDLNETREMKMKITSPSIKGKYQLQITLVQEEQFWFENIIDKLPVNLEVIVE